MSERKIKITIDPLGNPKIEAVGFAGMDCTAATKGLENALGGAADTSLKPEYYQENSEGEQQHQTW